MPTHPGDQASPEQPSASVSLLDDELMSLGEEGGGPGGGRAWLQVGEDAAAHEAACRAWSGQSITPASPAGNEGWSLGPLHSRGS